MLCYKKLPRKGIAALTNIANGIMRTEHYPEKWKIAEVIVFNKPFKEKKFPKNYRPTSLLSASGKVVERIIATRLNEETENLKLIPPEQFGFRREHSTEQRLLRLTEFITEGMWR